MHPVPVPDRFAPDTFASDNLPPREQWPDLLLGSPAHQYPALLNCVAELLDRWVETGEGRRPCIRTHTEAWTYADLHDRVNRIAHVLVSHGLRPGGRVLLRAPNTPMMVAAYLAVIKAGGIAVATMPLLRGREIAFILDKAQIGLALCDHRLMADMAAAQSMSPGLRTVLPMGGNGPGDLLALMQDAPGGFAAHPSRQDDVCLIAFTSGTTGQPKGTMHFHRDMLAICDAYAAQVLRARPDDVFIGTAPLAFTFGLGAVVLFPLRIGASAVLVEQAAPEALLQTIRTLRPTVCFTAPTAYRAMLAALQPGDTASLRICVSAGETLPAATWHAWHDATGLKLMDGIGATEMLHIFIAAPAELVRPGATGLPVPGYEAKLIGEDGEDLPRGSTGRLAVRGPTGCRYLADERQTRYVMDGWNVTGDTYFQDLDGYFWYRARSDDMIVSAGYNIAGPEVEAALLRHADVAECAVIGVPDEDRGMIVKAFVVLRPGAAEDARALQDWVKAEIAPYKYPRAVEFRDSLPRTETGKLQRFRLRQAAADTSAATSMATATPR